MLHLQSEVILIGKDYSDISEKDGLERATGGFQRNQLDGNGICPGDIMNTWNKIYSKGRKGDSRNNLEIEGLHID